MNCLIEDMQHDHQYQLGRKLSSIFFGGGTPSLFSGKSIESILMAAEKIFGFNEDIEITLEANPGAVSLEKFQDWKCAGVNRLSIGVQSFLSEFLKKLGRIHSKDDARDAIRFARQAGFRNINIDLMHGLEDQNRDDARFDLQSAIDCDVEHISWYQLTIEPNTVFYKNPPKLPDDDFRSEIRDQGETLLATAGYRHYEISAFSKPGQHCRHNCNYWQFGDYLGIGAGAHGKTTHPETNTIFRHQRLRQPKDYLNRNDRVKSSQVNPNNLPLEYFMNVFRLANKTSMQQFCQRTGLEMDSIRQKILQLKAKGLIAFTDEPINEAYIATTELGRDHLDTLLQEFVI